MTPWHSENTNNEKILVDCIDFDAYQLRTSKNDPYDALQSTADYSYATPPSYPTRSIPYPKTEAYRQPCASNTRGRTQLEGISGNFAGKSATRIKRKILGRYNIQGGWICGSNRNDRYINRQGQGRC
ncbi:hypothetical protein LCGC14_2577570, partial [marine sediment metagenome]